MIFAVTVWCRVHSKHFPGGGGGEEVHFMLGAILVDRKGGKGLMGVAVAAGPMFPFTVKDVCIAFMECKFDSC